MVGIIFQQRILYGAFHNLLNEFSVVDHYLCFMDDDKNPILVFEQELEK